MSYEMNTFSDTQLHERDFYRVCVREGLKGVFHVIRSDETHSFRAKKREDRFDACMARLRP
jgi:hypothetical protein